MFCPSCGSEVSGEYGFCPVCGATLDTSWEPETPVHEEERKPFGAMHVAAIAGGLGLGFSVTYFLGWTLFILIPVLMFGSGTGEVRRLLSYFALGMVVGLVIGILARSTRFNFI